jgi:hypothetical protein
MQELTVALIVALAFVYAVWRVTPQALRRLVAAALLASCRRLGWQGPSSLRLAERVAADASCGSCKTCGGCSAAKKAPLTVRSDAAPARESR